MGERRAKIKREGQNVIDNNDDGDKVQEDAEAENGEIEDHSHWGGRGRRNLGPNGRETAPHQSSYSMLSTAGNFKGSTRRPV